MTANREGNNAPVFSPDGRKIAFTECPGNTCSLLILDENSKAVTPIKIPELDVRFPDWCRDPGQPWIVFEGRSSAGQNIWRVNIEDGTLKQVTKGNSDISPSWSPDCSKIAFERYSGSKGLSDIFIYDLRSEKETQLTFSPDQDEINVAWSPDGRWIAYGYIAGDTNRDGYTTYKDQIDLYVISPDGSTNRNLSNGRYSIFGPSWSPGSDRIVFAAHYGDPNFKLVIFDFLNGGFEELTGIGPYYHPQWSP